MLENASPVAPVQNVVLRPVSDFASQMAADVLHHRGSRMISFWEHEGYRICQSQDPSGPNGEREWHVSVSKNGKAVSWNIAEIYAAKLLQHVKEWQRYDCTEKATHLFEVLS